MKYHECECCGGSLDPGEGRICDTCLEAKETEQQRKQLLDKMVRSTDYKQMKMEDYLK